MCALCRGGCGGDGGGIGRAKQPAGPPVTDSLLFPVAKAQEVLQAIRGYVRFFFGCRECAGHFEQMAAGSMHRVGSLNSAVLWFWSSHNKVNARLAGKEGPPPRPESPAEGG